MLQYTNKEKMSILKNLEIYRFENKLTLRVLAEKMDVHYVTLYNWLAGKKKPSAMHLYHIKKFIAKGRQK